MGDLLLFLDSGDVGWIEFGIAGMLRKVGSEPALLMGKGHRPCQIRGKAVEIRKRTILWPRVGEESGIPVVRENDELTADLPEVFSAGLLTLQSRVSAAAKDVPHVGPGVRALPILSKHIQPPLNKPGDLIWGELLKAAHGE